MKKWKWLYCILFFGICLIPSVGLFFTGPSVSGENRELAEFPKLKTEEGFNTNILQEMGDYFQEHFAFRNELVTADALVMGKGFGVSSVDSVIQGTDGWLYYKDSLADYQGTELLSDRSLYNIAHSLSMMEEYLKKKGVKMVFTVAPNKNSLYGENMPYYDKVKASEDKNLCSLMPYLEKEKVSYVDLYGALSAEEEILYHERDSHWNNKGAAFAAGLLLDALGKEHTDYETETYQVRTDFEGDLDKMLYPTALTPEDEIYYDKATTYAYVGEVGSNFDPKISTVNPAKAGSLVVFRDSFGNALLPFLAEEYANAYFTRGIPYQMFEIDMKQADTVIVERAERFLPDMALAPPALEAQEIVMEEEPLFEEADGEVSVGCENLGLLTQVWGLLPEGVLETETRIFATVNGVTYEAFPADVSVEGEVYDRGFTLYIPAEKLAENGNKMEIVLHNGTDYVKIKKIMF